MKKMLFAALALVMLAACKDGGSDSPKNLLDKITDPVFKEYCTRFDIDRNGVLTSGETKSVSQINVTITIDEEAAGAPKISSLKGIDIFTELTSLRCENNNLSSIDLSKNTKLTQLGCDRNHLSSLDVSKNMALTILQCSTNELTSLDVSNNINLKTLTLSYCNVSAIDISKNTALESFYCVGNEISTLDVSKNTLLKALSCFANKLSALDISKNTALEVLYCGEQNTSADLALTPGEANMSKWENTWRSEGLNTGVVLAE